VPRSVLSANLAGTAQGHASGVDKAVTELALLLQYGHYTLLSYS